MPNQLLELPRAIDLLNHHPNGFIYSDEERQILGKALAYIHELYVQCPRDLSFWLQQSTSYDWYRTILSWQYRLNFPDLRRCKRDTGEGVVSGSLEKVQLAMLLPLAWVDFSFKLADETNVSVLLVLRSAADLNAASIVFVTDIK